MVDQPERKTIMLRSYLTLFLVLIVAAVCKPQTDSSVNLLDITNPDSTQIAALLNETQKIYRNQPDRALKLVDKALDEAQKSNFEMLLSRAYSLRGVVLKNKGQFAEAIESHLNSLRINEKNDGETA